MSNLLDWLRPVSASGGRFTGLDGLRGLAMLMVIFIHLHLMGIGWIGLSSFFVLSGFLITRVLMSDQAKSDSLGDYLKRFYGRRSLRIFPIYYAYLTVLLVATYFIGRLEDVRENIPFAYMYVFNWYQVIEEPHHSRMLNHLWSLSVEEQFYLVWPFLLLFTPRRLFPWLALVVVASGPLVRYWISEVWFDEPSDSGVIMQQYLYVLTTSHLDAFALGALINFVSYRPKAWHYGLLIAVALVSGAMANGTLGAVDWDPHAMPLTLGWPLYMPDGFQYIWGYTLVNLFWFVIICSILTEGPVKQFFSIRILDFLGKRSYSTYIIHFPILALIVPIWHDSQEMFGEMLGTFIILPPYLLVVFVLADLTYRFIELPMLDLKERLWPDKAGKAKQQTSDSQQQRL